jgi:hypothetical protein
MDPKRESTLLFKRSHIDHEAVFYITFQQSFIGYIDIMNPDNPDIRSNLVLATKIEHLLGFGDSSDE